MKSQDYTKIDLPDMPGVYFFLNAKKKILYIGRATSLRERVRSYFASDVSETRGPKIMKMVEEARSIDFREVDSVLEAVLLEADLIKKFRPAYNTDLKDDKSNNCVVITDEEFPRVLVVRQKDLVPKASPLSSKPQALSPKLLATYGPFPEGGKLVVALKIIRKIFPYRDSRCIPNSGKPCFNRQIGLCPGVCTGEISKKEYAKTIQNIKRLFEGKKGEIIRSLKRDMRELATQQEFEKAGEAKRQLFALEHIADVALVSRSDTKRSDLSFIRARPKSLRTSEVEIGSTLVVNGGIRIEAYDIAHTSGKETVGVMVAVVDGVPDKSLYRKFKIRTAIAGDDVDALRELLTRRFKHTEWGMPDVVAIDGGVAQINLAREVLASISSEAALVSVVKDEHHRPSRILGDSKTAKEYRDGILLANREAHRFAITFHRKRRDVIPLVIDQ